MTELDLLLEIKGLKTQFFLEEGVVRAVDGVDLQIKRRQTLGVVGESGCGKSVTAFSILQLVTPPGRIVDGEVILHRRRENQGTSSVVEDVVLTDLDPRGREIRDIRGGEIAMIFQEPMSSLSAVHTVGLQILEAIENHMDVDRGQARERAIEMLGRVGIPNPEMRIDNYSFQLSGGMRQRAVIAIALACNPSLLIADEPTTALDVTTQAQIMDLMLELQQDMHMSIMLITHDLGVIAEMADDVAVMYLGHVVEYSDVDSIFHDPQHPYTQALLRSIPKVNPAARQKLDSIRGMVPDPYNRPPGCPFHPRCDHMMPGKCDRIVPRRVTLEEGREVRCLLYGGDDGE
jgi:peptide/nickel transport system ATP-binding protein